MGEDLKNIKDTGNPFEEVKAIINKDRYCEKFTEWQQGFTPKEHQELLNREREIKQENDRRKSNRIWHIAEVVITFAVGALIALLAASISNK